MHRRKNTCSDVPYYCSDQEVSAVRKTSASGGGLVTRLGTPGESLGAQTVLFGRRNVLLLERDSEKGQFWTVREELQLFLVAGLRESSSTAASYVPKPSSPGPTRSFLCKEESALNMAYSKDFHSLLHPSKALTKKRTLNIFF